MSSLSSILAIARSSLLAEQLTMSTTGNNIANAGTEGYSRQRVDLSPSLETRTGYGYVGTGVIAAHIGRVRQGYIDAQYWAASDGLGASNSQTTVLSQVQAALNEPSSTGLSATLGNFFNSFNDLALHPEESSYRSSVLQQATLATQTLHQIQTNLTQVRANLLNDVNAAVAQINRLTSDLASLDQQISARASTGVEPSDLLDERDLKLDQLSRLVPMTASTDDNGGSIVSIGGAEVASGGRSVALKASVEGGQVVIRVGDSPVPVSFSSGELGGTVQMYNSTIPGFLQKLDALASALITNVNAIHQAGYGLGTPAPTGTAFFTGTSAADIAVNPAIEANSALIAASSDGSAGNNDVARSLANLKDAGVLDGGTTSIVQFYNNFVSSVGSTLNQAQYEQKTQNLILTQIDSQRQSVSGVSIDEEMTNMIKFQRAYQASAKIVSTVDEMMQSLIQMV